jgi:hypothetical protein
MEGICLSPSSFAITSTFPSCEVLVRVILYMRKIIHTGEVYAIEL